MGGLVQYKKILFSTSEKKTMGLVLLESARSAEPAGAYKKIPGQQLEKGRVAGADSIR